MSVNVRAAVLSDAPTIARIHVAAWQSAYRGILPHDVLATLDVERRTKLWQSLVAEEKLRVLVADVDRSPVGFIDFASCRDADVSPDVVAEVNALYIDPPAWRSGVGAALWNAALAEIRREGRERVLLWVLSDNERGRRFYERVGCVADGATRVESLGNRIKSVRYEHILSK